MIKQMQVTEKKIGDNTFYIKPFPAFTAANLSGEIGALITPILAAIAPAFGGNDNTNTNLMDVQVEDALPHLSNAFSGLSGDKFEMLMRKLLIINKNISVEGESTDGEVKSLTYDLANEVFCGEVQDMYILCFEVIKLNFSGFFKKLGTRFGDLKGVLQEKIPSLTNTEPSMSADSEN